MTSRIGSKRISAGRDPRSAGFTLVELMLVMAMLVIVLGIAAPSLSRFFAGRSLDSEARRFVALTRYGQNLAVSEGIPYLLSIDAEQRRYRLQAEYGTEELLEQPSRELQPIDFELARGVYMEADTSLGALRPLLTGTPNTLTPSRTIPWKRTLQLVGEQPTLRFTPDGFISETSPEYVRFREGEADESADDDVIWVGQSRNRLHYEIWTNPPSILRR